MKKIKHKVNVDNIDDEYKSLVKEEMTNAEVTILGTVIVKHKIERMKNKLFGWYYAKKNSEKNKKEI
jgi:hypothetical protein